MTQGNVIFGQIETEEKCQTNVKLLSNRSRSSAPQSKVKLFQSFLLHVIRMPGEPK
jgi:hypothetical protein